MKKFNRLTSTIILALIILTSLINPVLPSESPLLAQSAAAAHAKPDSKETTITFDRNCAGCKECITGKSFIEYKGKYYCEECSWDYVTECSLCGCEVGDGIISPTNKLFCEKCYNKYHTCANCGEPAGPEEKEVAPGCFLCSRCIPGAVITYEDLKPVYDEALYELKKLDIVIYSPVESLSIMNKEELVKNYGTGATGDEMAFVDYGNEGYRIFILQGLNYKQILLTLCHEIAHIWDDENIYIGSEIMSEGFAEWLAYHVMINRGYLEEAEDMYLNPDEIYGQGLRNLLDLEKEHGFSGTLDYFKNDYEDISWYDRGCSLMNQEKYKEAIECFDKAIELNPDDSDAWFNKGYSYYELDEPDKELMCYEKVLEINPEDGDAWYNKGCVLYDKGLYKEAIECYDMVMELEPDAQDAKEAKEDALNRLKENQ